MNKSLKIYTKILDEYWEDGAYIEVASEDEEQDGFWLRRNSRPEGFFGDRHRASCEQAGPVGKGQYEEANQGAFPVKRKGSTRSSRRTSYRSGRLELIGFDKKSNPFRRQLRFVRDKNKSQLLYTPFKGNFRWKMF